MQTITDNRINNLVNFLRSAPKHNLLEKSNLYLIKDSQNRIINKTSIRHIAENYLSQGYTIEYL